LRKTPAKDTPATRLNVATTDGIFSKVAWEKAIPGRYRLGIADHVIARSVATWQSLADWEAAAHLERVIARSLTDHG
jgi:hypothetical protein